MAPQQAFARADRNYAAAYRYVDRGLEPYFPLAGRTFPPWGP